MNWRSNVLMSLVTDSPLTRQMISLFISKGQWFQICWQQEYLVVPSKKQAKRPMVLEVPDMLYSMSQSNPSVALQALHRKLHIKLRNTKE